MFDNSSLDIAVNRSTALELTRNMITKFQLPFVGIERIEAQKTAVIIQSYNNGIIRNAYKENPAARVKKRRYSLEG